MSIELENPPSILGKVDAIGNFIGQIRLASMLGDKKRVEYALAEAERLVSASIDQLEELEAEMTALRNSLSDYASVNHAASLLLGQ